MKLSTLATANGMLPTIISSRAAASPAATRLIEGGVLLGVQGFAVSRTMNVGDQASLY